MKKKNIIIVLGVVFALIAAIVGITNYLNYIKPCPLGSTACPPPPCAAPQAAPAEIDLDALGNPDGVAIIAAPLQNNPVPNLSPTVTAVLTAVLAQGGQVGIVSATATPTMLNADIIPQRKSDTDKWKAYILGKNLDAIESAIQTPPTSPGMSMFNGLFMARDWVRSSPQIQHPVYILIGSGLDDSGSMTTTNGLLLVDPEQAASFVKKANPTFDLTGAHVILSSIGYTMSPQSPLDPQQQSTLRNLWSTVLAQGFGAQILDDPAPTSQCSVDTGQPVQPTPPPVGVICDADTVQYTLPGIFFETGDSSLNSQAQSALSDLVAFVTANPGVTRVDFDGYTDTVGSAESNQILSEQRSQSVMSWVEPQISSSITVTATGHGESDLKVAEDGLSGLALAQAQAENRRVTITVYGATVCPDEH